MGDECKSCKKWEEDIYWSHFQVVQFFQVLSGRFDHQLAIPQKFANNLREKLTGPISLKGPSGATWEVGLTAKGDTLFLKDGWKEFVDAHILEGDDLLIFKYNGNSRFDVLVFDRQSFCEKEASYFIKKCAHSDVISGGKTKRSIPESCDATNESSHEIFEGTATKNPRKDGACTPTSGTRANGRLRTREVKSTPTSTRAVAYSWQLKSNRRAIDEEEKKKAFDMATAAIKENSFLVVMRPSHVYKGFYMSIPSEWARVHLPRRSLDLILRVKENMWGVRFHHRVVNGGPTGGLTGGWRTFVVENFLEEFDVCVFDLTSAEDGAPVLDVSIFRVVEEVIPPSRLTSPSSTRGRKPKLMKKKSVAIE